jgi:flagellar biosynthetic protein FlhB
MSDDAGEKTEDPSQYKIDESRKKGEVASSKELSSVLILAGTLTTLVLSSIYIFETMSHFLEWIFSIDAQKAYDKKMLQEIIGKMVKTGGLCVAPVFAVSFCLGILAQVMQIGFLFAPDVLQLKFDRINPMGGIKKIFSKKSLVEVVKGLFKFTIIISITYSLISDTMFSFNGFLNAEIMQTFTIGQAIIYKLFLSILLGLGLVALGDFAWEKHSYKQKLMMTKQQAKEENKEKDGNPEVKQKIRQIQRDMATQRVIEDVKSADVIITNPTHISIAIKYDTVNMVAPAVVAKGSDLLAMRMREVAKEFDIPIVENVPIARALYKTVKTGHGVPNTMYKSVAEILAFVYRLKKNKNALK